MPESSQAQLTERFAALHRPGQPLLLPNPWDAGSARLLAWLGFEALATTSSGAAATFGLRDGEMGAERALANAAAIVEATPLPVSADLEDGFADGAEGVARTARGAIAAGLAGFSIEDYTGDDAAPIYDVDRAAERVRAAAEAAHAGPARLVVTGRCENHLHGRDDLADTIARLQAYQEAGADVLYAPGLSDADQIRSVVESVDRPVSVLARAGVPPVPELAALGVARVSVGGAFAFAALDMLVEAARELRDQGTYGYAARAAPGAKAAAEAFAVSAAPR
ncbi:MAG TPA: isocitrate lyase/phosphoenolpyruvate mutase family protein [Solirubrobacteraceae bacterium]|nr:isocitrate lyase/phosphoenolpyruvate mutase family protein [Solirubrobacteraceae bacterium]